MSKQRRTAVFLLLLMAVSMSGAAVSSSLADSPPPTVEELVAGDTLSGEALAGDLGLVLEPTLPSGCYYFSEVEDGFGYCLDTVVNDSVHQNVLADVLRGRDVTADELEAMRIMATRGAE